MTSIVPPSQGRVYRPERAHPEFYWRSALTRAGISFPQLFCSSVSRFRPHKGGYIGKRGFGRSKSEVPPSQGRVYHPYNSDGIQTMRSALTRAGISATKEAFYPCKWFRPHKGGYIGGSCKKWKNSRVPPSQGRVYRGNQAAGFACNGSALTRAGISQGFSAYTVKMEFRPHKGGYIGYRQYMQVRCGVPPSQGRVYRPVQHFLPSFASSALTRAGISPPPTGSHHGPSFRPHKGGYIILYQ